MKCNLRALSVALAAAGLVVSVGAHASNDGIPGFGEHEHDTDVTAQVGLTNNAAITINNSVTNNSTSNFTATGNVVTNSNVAALVDDKQVSHASLTTNDDTYNTARVGSDSLDGANGNIGVNAAAGNGNQQANMTAVAASGSADANSSGCQTGCQSKSVAADAQGVSSTVNVLQDSQYNFTFNHGTVNSATVGTNVLNNAQGNIGVNAAAGNGNQQKNDTALASSGGNIVNATATGTAIQQSFGNVVDNDLADCTALALGLHPNVTNTATAGSNILNGAQGNIGVNVAAGTGNQQLNSLSMTYASAK